MEERSKREERDRKRKSKGGLVRKRVGPWVTGKMAEWELCERLIPKRGRGETRDEADSRRGPPFSPI